MTGGQTFICDVCGAGYQDLDACRVHLAAAHGVTDAAELGQVEQRDGLLILRNGGQEPVVVDLA